MKTLAALGALTLAGIGLPPEHEWPIPHVGAAAAQSTIGRLHYDGGGDWYANPSSLPNLLAEIRTRTSLETAEREQVLTLDSPELWETSFLYMTGHGDMLFSDADVSTLERYLGSDGCRSLR